MRLSDLQPTVTTMEIVHPVMGATGVTLNLVGQDTKVFRDKAKALAKTATAKSARDVDLDSLIGQANELAAVCIVGWSGLDDENGEPIPYSPAKALELMSDPGLTFIKEQVETFVAERKNFFRPTGE